MVRLKLEDVLLHLMRPAGGGIPAFSAGKGGALHVQRKLYGGALSEAQILTRWKKSWKDLVHAQTVLIGVPSDTGAGIRRGAAYGPRAVREALLNHNQYRRWLKEKKIVDLGDIYVNPHLLHDEMLANSQKRQCQEAMYSKARLALRRQLAVSALSQLEQVLRVLLAQHPHLKIFIIGGDHSVAWPVTKVMATRFPQRFGVVQPDAHTDLLSARLGVKYCFGTWSFHAAELIGPQRLVQLGIRQSAFDKKYWASRVGTKQFWAHEIKKQNEDKIVAQVISHLKAQKVKTVYFSNDIDGTDERFAFATGTPAPQGLRPQFLLKIIAALGAHFDLKAADIMEVAPDLARNTTERKRTCDLAARYALACLAQQLKSPRR